MLITPAASLNEASANDLGFILEETCCLPSFESIFATFKTAKFPKLCAQDIRVPLSFPSTSITQWIQASIARDESRLLELLEQELDCEKLCNLIDDLDDSAMAIEFVTKKLNDVKLIKSDRLMSVLLRWIEMEEESEKSKLIKFIEGLPFTVDDLLKHSFGKTIRKLEKETTSETLKSDCKKIIRKWLKMAEEHAEKSKDASQVMIEDRYARKRASSEGENKPQEENGVKRVRFSEDLEQIRYFHRQPEEIVGITKSVDQEHHKIGEATHAFAQLRHEMDETIGWHKPEIIQCEVSPQFEVLLREKPIEIPLKFVSNPLVSPLIRYITRPNEPGGVNQSVLDALIRNPSILQNLLNKTQPTESIQSRSSSINNPPTVKDDQPSFNRVLKKANVRGDWKTQPCRNYIPGQPSSCPYGSRCTFIHDDRLYYKRRKSFNY